MFCMTSWKVFPLFVFDYISCSTLVKITFLFFVGEKYMACESRREYCIVESKLGREIFWKIYQEAPRLSIFA